MPGGGESKQTQTQQSTTRPLAESMPLLNGILGQLQGQLGKTGLTGAENNALAATQANAANFSDRFAPIMSNNSSELLSGGGALNQAGNVNQNYLDYRAATQPLASNTNYNPYDTPGFRDAIGTLTSDITQGVNGQFAAAGRDFSGYNQKTLGRGIMEGVAPAIQAQYNQNVQNQQSAANRLFDAGNTNAGLLSGLQQQALANKQIGTDAATKALDAQNTGANATLLAEAMRRGIPMQSLGLLANIGVPIAGLGSQSSGTATGTNKMSGAQQFATIASGIGSLWPKAPISFGT